MLSVGIAGASLAAVLAWAYLERPLPFPESLAISDVEPRTEVPRSRRGRAGVLAAAVEAVSCRWPHHHPTYGLVVCLVVGIAAVALALPASRAARTDPATVLRDE